VVVSTMTFEIGITPIPPLNRSKLSSCQSHLFCDCRGRIEAAYSNTSAKKTRHGRCWSPPRM
jgi:hypothetical protein